MSTVQSNHHSGYRLILRQGRRLGCLLAIILLLVLGFLLYRGWQLSQIAERILLDGRSALSLARDWHDPAALRSLEPLLETMRRDTELLHAEAAPLLAMTNRLGWLPVYGPDLAAAGPLLDTAVHLATAADAAYAGMAPVVINRDPAEPIRITLVRSLVPPPPELAAASTALDEAAADWSQVPLAELSPALQQRLEPIDYLLPLAQDSLSLVPVLPDMLGANGPRDYLFLAQNPDELRATGGFIGAAGILTLKGARVDAFSLQHSGTINDFTAGPYPAPPEPLRRYMHIELWAFQDANWSPDFPTAAYAAMDLYRRGQGRSVDGVIAATPEAMRLLLDATGPLTVEDAAEAVSADALDTYLQTQFDRELEPVSDQPRKAYIGKLAEAIVAKIDNDLERMNALALIDAFRQALDQRHLLIYTQEPDAAAFLAGRGWDGAVQPGNHDFLMIVDANLGYNKVNRHIQQSHMYSVDLSDTQAPTATLTISHTNQLASGGECRQWRGGSGPLTYEQVSASCYWNYLRVLVPHGSTLTSIRTNAVPDDWMHTGQGDTGTVTISAGAAGSYELSTFLVVPFAETSVTRLDYGLPPAVLSREAHGWHYRLHWQKQSGREAIPTTLQIRLPAGAGLLSASPAPAHYQDDLLTFDVRPDRDLTVDIVFRPS